MTTYEEVKLFQALKKKYDNIPEDYRKKWDKEIDAEQKRKHKKNAIADDPYDYAKGRHLGKQDIGDISYHDVWQKILRDQTGITMPMKTTYRCPVCGYEHLLDMPPERCFRCGAHSFLHMPGIVKLKC